MKLFDYISLAIQLCRNMGLRYVIFRIKNIIQRKVGWLKVRFPESVDFQPCIPLSEWRSLDIKFFKKDEINLKKHFPKSDLKALREYAEDIRRNQFQFFSSTSFDVEGWHTNPETGFQYDPYQHWSEVPDFSETAGDIKYVWEKSRFTFLYQLIRYDFHFKADQSDLVFSNIESWIDGNPVNCGPNWKCSQEITLRVLNWTFALHYYKHSDRLTEPVFNKIVNSIFNQMQHIEENLSFSRTAVRNNHAITEALGLYLIGLLYPFFTKSKSWKEKGRKAFEEEIEYQIYDDGTFLQSSMNYHRVVVQLLTWAIRLSEVNGETWTEIVYERAIKSLHFLKSCQDDVTGWLPNYGNNDGSLFFPLSGNHYRDFRPQLGALSAVLGVESGYKPGSWMEETFWLFENTNEFIGQGFHPDVTKTHFPVTQTFTKGGYFVLRDERTLTFLRSASYRDRPFQADNMHLDLWVNGENILRDAGTFKYNTTHELKAFFTGTASHNTVMIGGNDQMRVGPGFIWYDWIQKSEGSWRTDKDGTGIVFEGSFEGFKKLGEGIVHRRCVTKRNGVLHWTVEDFIEKFPSGMVMNQFWHPSETFDDNYKITAFNSTGNEINPESSKGWYSDFYGQKTESRHIIFSTNTPYIKTIIEKRESQSNIL